MTVAEAAYVARLTRRAAQVSPELARAQLRAYEMVREALTEAELASAIRSGQMDALLDRILNDPRGGPFARLKARLDQATLDAARAEAGFLPPPFRPDVFDTLSPHVVEAVQKLDTRVIKALSDEIRETVRHEVRLGLEAGKGPRTIAREVKAHVGLAPNQAKAVANFRRQLESGDRAALNRVLSRGTITLPDGGSINRMGHAGGEGLSGRDLSILDRKLGEAPLTPEQIDRMTRAYSKRMLAWNAETHARTVALDANKLANRLSWEDAAARGIVERGALYKVWVTVGDERVRPEHAALNGHEVAWDSTFPNGETIPGEQSWNCRCVARTVYRPQAMPRAA